MIISAYHFHSSPQRPLSNSSRHLNGKAGYSSYGESEEENLRRRDKYLNRDEVDDSSATEGGIRHWKNDVYLHSSAGKSEFLKPWNVSDGRIILLANDNSLANKWSINSKLPTEALGWKLSQYE